MFLLKGMLMATDVAPSRKFDRIKSLYRSFARIGKRGRNRPDVLAAADETSGRQSDGRPESPIVQVTTLGNKPIEPGLAAVWGWAYSNDLGFPEGVSRPRSMTKTSGWSSRTACPARVARPGDPWKIDAGFRPPEHLFTEQRRPPKFGCGSRPDRGKSRRKCEVTFRVNHAGRLAKTTTRLIKNALQPKTNLGRSDRLLGFSL